MEINKENYEAYLLDLWEDNLSEDRKVMLYSFLEEHPEFNEDDALSLLSDISITDSKAIFDKSSIDFEHINPKNYEYFFIAYLEGDLSKEEMNSVDSFLEENPHLNEKFRQFSKAKLPIETVYYPNKEKLILGKTRVISIQTRRWFMGVVAASIVFLIWIRIPIQETPYLYTMSDLVDLKIEIHTNDSSHIDQSIRPMTSDNQITQQFVHTAPKVKLVSKKKKKMNDVFNGNEDSNPSPQIEIELDNLANIKAMELTNVIASIKPDGQLPVELSQEEISLNNCLKNKETIPTVVDFAALYLQRKSILNEERKPNIKGIINNLFAKVNRNQEPILASSEESKTKTTIFQFGDLKIEQKTAK